MLGLPITHHFRQRGTSRKGRVGEEERERVRGREGRCKQRRRRVE